MEPSLTVLEMEAEPGEVETQADPRRQRDRATLKDLETKAEPQ